MWKCTYADHITNSYFGTDVVKYFSDYKDGTPSYSNSAKLKNGLKPVVPVYFLH